MPAITNVIMKDATKIGVISLKGGDGKTQIACQLTARFAQEKRDKVLLIDTDEQETAYDFSCIRSENQLLPQFDCIKVTGIDVRKTILSQEQNYSVIIVDAGGSHTEALRATLSACNIILVPVPPKSESIWSFNKLAKIINDMKKANPKMKLFCFLNKADHQGHDNNDTISYLERKDLIKYINTTIKNRKAFSNAISQGYCINELKGRFRDTKATDELEQLYRQIKLISENVRRN